MDERPGYVGITSPHSVVMAAFTKTFVQRWPGSFEANGTPLLIQPDIDMWQTANVATSRSPYPFLSTPAPSDSLSRPLPVLVRQSVALVSVPGHRNDVVERWETFAGDFIEMGPREAHEDWMLITPFLVLQEGVLQEGTITLNDFLT